METGDSRVPSLTWRGPDGGSHAWLQDVIVDPSHQRSGLGRQMVAMASAESSAAGCEWLHVDFDDDLADFYLRVCGFEPTAAGLMRLGAAN